MNHSPFLVLDRVSKRYGPTVAVDSFSLAVPRGDFVCLLGPSGCGKTTTLRMIAGFIRPEAGDIRIDGRSVLNVPIERRSSAMVFQNYALFPHLSVFENVAFGLRMRRVGRGEMRSRVAAALDLVHLPGLEDRYPRQLSGGQQQRVALARAVIVEPQVLLLDEPLSNLDAKLREEMRIELRRIQQALGITAVFVTHDLQEAFALADTVVVMSEGTIRQVGSPSDIYERPVDDIVAKFVGIFNRVPATIERISEDGATAELLIAGSERAPSPAAPWMRRGDAVILRIRPERLRLDSAKESGSMSLRATLERMIYLGPIVQYLLTSSGIPLIISSPNTSDLPRLAPGAEVTVSWTPRDAGVTPA